MKKLLFVIVMMLGGTSFSSAVAEEPEEVVLHIIDEAPITKGNTRAPRRPLVLAQDGYVLTLPAMSTDLTLQLRDAEGSVVYSTFLMAGTTEIILPTTLTGTYEIRLVADTYYYIGCINL